MINIDKEFQKWWHATRYKQTTSTTNDPTNDYVTDYDRKTFKAGYQKGQESGKKEARKGYVKLEDVIEILEINKWEQTIGVSPVIGMKAIEEIKKLDNKKVTLEDVLLAEQSRKLGGEW